jgi:hypothetical protein
MSCFFSFPEKIYVKVKVNSGFALFSDSLSSVIDYYSFISIVIYIKYIDFDTNALLLRPPVSRVPCGGVPLSSGSVHRSSFIVYILSSKKGEQERHRI